MASMNLPPSHDTVLKLFLRGSRTPNNKYPNVSLGGQTVLVTGSNSGIGLACAHILPTLGVSHLILAVRSTIKGEEAATPIRKAHPGTKVEVWELDMLSYPSIQAFARKCATLPRIDIAILNAGVSSGSVSKINASTGHEETFQVNYFSTALLSLLLLPVLKPKSSDRYDQPGRLTIVGSGMGLLSTFENRNTVPLIPSFDVPFSGFQAAGERYAVTKTLVMMLVHKLSEAVDADDVIVNTVEPGFTSGTALHRDYSWAGKISMALMKKFLSRTPEQAAWTYLDAAAVKGRESHGGFVMFWEVFPFHQMMHTREGKQTMERLWDETMAELEFAGVRQILESIRRKQ
ncbi:short-chain dehydrogenase/reductase family protein [Cucurbitaria berberidis CBS 394.84]|uniref:Short-chain dehydrogenase/reductase family protein n=1 Tax=Cucurbitaria berberidis CBS 394.84 TaxID=1168544 RepID=A0A9P4GNQ7_9PLEO|nr:short-chain dehydrogenase/reductase family protein [Cucurbitaria berberidis CBS 394.84]KAF1849032.1 short-chain dehydrogenase/reductase family protein [Cucurbitaria berberidis CBS 394.84]